MNKHRALPCIVGIAAVLGMPAAEAASVSLLPASSTVPLSDGTGTLELFMDFTDDPTIGGGIDLALSGPISFNSFTPSAYFSTVPEAGFTGYGAAAADADFEIHFGNFAGLSGLNKLGDVRVNLLGTGAGQVAININSAFGDFYSTGSIKQIVSLNGAQVNVVPLPATAWLFATGFGLVGGWRRLVGKPRRA